MAAPALTEVWEEYEQKMKDESQASRDAFKYNLGVLLSGKSVMIPDAELEAVQDIQRYEDITGEVKAEYLKKTVVLKLNGGLGTGMGLDKAKSLLTVTEGLSFLDLIAKQVEQMKKDYNTEDLKFMLMNSFSTSEDTLKALEKYAALGTGSDLEFVQNRAPKVDASSFKPVTWEEDPSHEWCPPGHGDLYPAMLGSGTLDRLLEKGYQYMFVSNSDNLGATMDLKVLTYFVESGAPFLMEVADRTEADKKGGHLAQTKSGLLLREAAQCPPEDEKKFQDIEKYKYFNTNNLWVDLTKLQEIFKQHGGSVPLPVIQNQKTVDPRKKESTKVYQLETAMGAAIECFAGAKALVIPRSRFAPVKTTNDLLALRSDAYVLTDNFCVVLDASRDGVPPNVKLDGKYKFTDKMEELIPQGKVPSLKECKKLVIEGDMQFAAGVTIKGEVTIKNTGDKKRIVPPGTYEKDFDVTNVEYTEPGCGGCTVA